MPGTFSMQDLALTVFLVDCFAAPPNLCAAQHERKRGWPRVGCDTLRELGVRDAFASVAGWWCDDRLPAAASGW